MKILLITPTSDQAVGFRAKLIESLQGEGHDVSVLTFDDKNRGLLEERRVDFHFIPDANRSMNPFRVLTLKSRYCKVIRKISPDIVFTFMLKPNAFGVPAAKRAGVKKIYSMVEGAGDAFINGGAKWRVIRTVVCGLYRRAFRHCERVFFLNEDDKAEFIRRGLVREAQCEVVHGIGVDLEKFAYRPVKNRQTFLMVARMLRTKGVLEYCECARAVRKKYPQAVFNYLGGEGTVKVSDIREYIDDGSINYLGTTKDVRPYYEECTAYVLPSYREGMPMSVMEAEAIGRMVLVTDVNGCRDTVRDGYNGFLISHGDLEKMEEKVVWCIEHPEEAEQMGKNARAYAEENFDQKKINEKILQILSEK